MSSSTTAFEAEQKELLETIVTNLPLEKSSRSFTTTRFLFGLLRTTNIPNASKACRATLEKKIGMQLEQATLDDLLIPNYSYLNETLNNVDCVERILSHFLDGLQETNQTDEDGNNGVRSSVVMLFEKLINGYFQILLPTRISNRTNSIKRSSSVACSSCNPFFFSNAALQASEALSIFAVLNNLNRNLVAVENLELFSNGRLVTIVSNSSFCSNSKAVVDDRVG